MKKTKQIETVLTASEIPVKALKNWDRLAYEEPVDVPVIIKKKGK